MSNWTSHVKLTGDWNKIQATLRRGVFEARLEQFVGLQMAASAAEAVRLIRAFMMQSGKYRKNRPMTVMIKQASTHLVDNRRLYESVEAIRVNWDEWWVGASTRRLGSREIRIAHRLHTGVKIKITARMRRMFELIHAVWLGRLNRSVLTGRAKELYSRNPRGPWMSFGKKKRLINIPKRPFIEKVKDNKTFQLFFRRAMMRAVRQALKL